jgi:glutamyl-tRNA synthetase
LLAPFLARSGIDPRDGPDPAAVADAYRERAQTLAEMADAAHYFYRMPPIDAAVVAQHLTPDARALIAALVPRLAAVEPWTRETLLPLLKSFAADSKVKLPLLMMPLRVALTGTTSSPSVDAVMSVLGRERTLARLAALE